MKTFREIWQTPKAEILAIAEENQRHQVWQQMDAANRKYRDCGYSGNYLQDFLGAHGDEEASPIKFHPGDPWQSGPGIKFINNQPAPVPTGANQKEKTIWNQKDFL